MQGFEYIRFIARYNNDVFTYHSHKIQGQRIAETPFWMAAVLLSYHFSYLIFPKYPSNEKMCRIIVYYTDDELHQIDVLVITCTWRSFKFKNEIIILGWCQLTTNQCEAQTSYNVIEWFNCFKIEECYKNQLVLSFPVRGGALYKFRKE